MDTTDESSSFIKQQSKPKLIIKFGRNIIHQQQQQQQQCKEAAEEEVMMMMMMKNKNMSVSNSPNSISNNSDSSLSPTTCSICGKSFPSKQSLCGHMKSHPERERRGIQPPPPPPPPPLDQSQSQSQSLSVRLFYKKYSPASTTDSDDSRKSVESYQGVGPLPINWSVRGKRGRPSNINDAIEGLLLLKIGNALDVALMKSKQISKETEGMVTDTISKKRKKKKRMILESSSEDVSRSSDVLRSSKKIKIDQERSCGNSRDGFDANLISSSIIQSSQLEEQLPAAAAAASNMFQEDCGLVKNVSKKVRLADERISYGSSRDVIPCNLEQLPKKLKLDDERGCSSGSSRGMFETGSHLQPMYSNGYVFDSKLFNNSIPSSTHLEHIPTLNGYFQGGFNSAFSKPAIIATAKKKVKENEKGSSAADQNMGMQVSGYEFKCDTCNRTFPSHQALGGHKSSQRNCKNSNGSNISYPFDHDQYLQCRESMLAVELVNTTEAKIPPTSYTSGGSHRCEHCGLTFGTGQALGGHKRRHYTGGLNTSGTVHVNSTTMTQTDQLTVKSAMALTDQLIAIAQTEKLIKKEEMNRLSVVPVASSVGEEVNSTTTVTKTENKPPVLDFDLNEIDLNETPNEMLDESWK